MQIRQQTYELDTAKRAKGEIVDGTEKIQRSIAGPAQDRALDQALEDMVTVGAFGGKPSAPRRSMTP